MPTNKEIVAEIQSKRTESSKTYLLQDGSYRAVFSRSPIHYQDEYGNYHNINTDLFDEADFDTVDTPVTKEVSGEFQLVKGASVAAKKKNTLNRDNLDFQALKVPFQARLPRNWRRGYTIGKGKDKITFKPVDGSPAKGYVEADKTNCVMYQDAWNDTDVCLEVQSKGIKETLTLKTDRAPSSFRFEIKGKDIGDNFTAGGLNIEPAWLIDANGIKRDVSMEVVRHNDNKVYLDLNADVTDLGYPIEIDPTVITKNYSNLSNGDTFNFSVPTGVEILEANVQYTPTDTTNSVYEDTGFTEATTNSTTYTDVLQADQTKHIKNIVVEARGQIIDPYDNRKSSRVTRTISDSSYFNDNWEARSEMDIVDDSTGEVRGSIIRNSSTYAIGPWTEDDSPYTNVSFEHRAFLSITTNYYIDLDRPRLQVNSTTSGDYYGVIPYGESETVSLDNVQTGTNNCTFYCDEGQTDASIEVTYNYVPTAPIVISPNGGETWDTQHMIEWDAASDEDDNKSDLTYQIQLSTDDGDSWNTLVSQTDGGATSYEYDFSDEMESSTCLLRIRAYDGGHYGPWDQSDGVFTIQHNLSPDMPNQLTPSGGSPIDRNSVQRFLWQYNDPNSGDTQSKFNLRWREKGTTSWNEINQVTPNEYYDMPADTFSHGEVEWQIRTYDQEGLSSPWSSTETFLAGNHPSMPTITSPSDTVAVANPTVQWSSSGQEAYRLTVKDDSGAAVYEHEGNTNKAHTIQYDLANNSEYIIELQIQNADGLWSDSDAINITVSYTPPATPEVEVLASNSEGIIVLDITNPAPVDTEPEVTHNNIYRRVSGGDWTRIATEIPANESYTDYTPASGQEYEYYIRARGDNGTYSDSDEVRGEVTLKGIWLHDVANPEETLHQFKYFEQGRGASKTLGGSMMQFEGRSLPMAEYSEREEQNVQVTLQIKKDSGDMEKLRGLIQSRNTLLYRDARGRRIFCAVFALSETDEPWGYSVPLDIQAVYREEEV
nr:hypothetical protein [Alteribacillus persepolensis]